MFEHVPHPHIHRRAAHGPSKVADHYPASTRIDRFNSAFALAITKGVGTMWCAYAFGILALFGLPGAISQGVVGVVQWVAQTFLQLVLLSVIIVGQNIAAAASDKRALDTYNDAEAILHEAVELQKHLAEQDKLLAAAVDRLHLIETGRTA